MIKPPITAIAIGARKLPPAPRASATGVIPRINAKVVIRIGRRRVGPAIKSASVRLSPCARRRFAKSTSKIEFLTANPISKIRPITAVMSAGVPVIISAPNAPMIASGNANINTMGWVNDPNWDASTMYMNNTESASEPIRIFNESWVCCTCPPKRAVTFDGKRI